MSNSLKYITRIGVIWALLLSSSILLAQEAKISTDIDKKEMLIGEQIKYGISVETDSTNIVQFPEGQTFMPLEMVSSSAIDTFRQQERYRLVKEYYITQFDSGAYTIPSQKIRVGDKFFSTDSTLINIHTIAVDTLKQPMYGIKPIINVPNPTNKTYKWIAIIIVILIVIGFLVYWFFFRKKSLTEEEKIKLLPPFERAILGLKNLQNSKYLIESKHKEYYSELTDIVRKYLEEEVHISATESTTDELLEKIQLLQNSGKLHLNTETIQNLRRVLQNADLVKFAKSQPTDSIAENDRSTIEQVVVKTKEALPEPTPEEIMQNELYQQEIKTKKARKKKIITIVSIIIGFFILIMTTISYFGISYVKDKILGNTSRELVESDWITSDYGYPITQLSTPKILKRKMIQLPKEAMGQIKTLQVFEYGSILGGLNIVTTINTYQDGTQVDPEMAISGILKGIEKEGAKNILTKQEEYTTSKGVKGLKIYGSLEVPPFKDKDIYIKKYYELYVFNENGALQQLLITYNENDTFGKEITERIIQSIDFKTE